MQNKVLSRLASCLLTLASVLGSIAPAIAAANEFTGAITVSPSTTSSEATQTITFTPASALASGDTIVLTYPSDSFTFGSLAASDVSATQSGTTFGTETISSTDRTITIPVTTASPGTGEVSITVGDSNKMTNPSTEGQYSISIMTKTGDVVDQTGYALASIANNISVTATVAEALILTIDTSNVDLIVDPSVNNGEDSSEKTTMTAKTNAASGYKIQAKLAGGTSTNSAQLDNASGSIPSGNAFASGGTGENLFGYVAYNSDVTKTSSELKSESSSVAQTFAAGTAANMTLYNGTADGVGNSGPTNSQVHTVYYALNVDYLTPAGTYEGTITYVALPTF